MIYECVGSEKEKIKQKFADIIDGLNSCGKIDYSTYCSLFDSAMDLFDKMYDEGCKHSDETLKEENDRIRRTMLNYSECITEHQNKIEKLERENKSLKQDWQIMKSTITELDEKIETTKKCLLENKHLLSDTLWVDKFTTLFDYLGIDDE